MLLSKLVSALLQPLAWVALLLMLGLRAQRPRTAAMAVRGALILLLLVGWLPLPESLIRSLENRYAVPAEPLDDRYVGVIVLGGATEAPYLQSGGDEVALNDAAERMTQPVVLLRRHPAWKLLFTGGEASIVPTGLTEAILAERYFRQMGVAPQQLVLEAASRTTDENARLSAALPGVDRTRPWLLLTSAWHMPRAVASFRAAGWNVTPYPVDRQSAQTTPWDEYSLARGARKWQLLLHEGVGLASGMLAGRRDF